jgi:hypothetical protein
MQLDKNLAKWGRIVDKKGLTIYEIDSIVQLDYLITYLNKFPLQSVKNIAYCKWVKLLNVNKDGGRGYDYETLKEMAQNINKYSDEDKVQT